MLDVEVIADPAAAVSALDPIRSRLLAELSEPASAATLASRVGIVCFSVYPTVSKLPVCVDFWLCCALQPSI